MKVILNRKMLKIIIAVLLVMAFFNVKAYAADESFALDKENLNVVLNGSGFINYDGGTGSIEWKSSDESIATVENGKVIGHKIGTTTITATRGDETDTCEINVIYYSIAIKGNHSNVNLVLNVYPSENLYATVRDKNGEVVNNAKVTWTSSDKSIVTVDENTGVITGLKAGTATITATAAGVTGTYEVTVVNGPEFTDFSNAKYELIDNLEVELKITGITPKKEGNYYYIITPNNTKPTIPTTTSGAPDVDFGVGSILEVNTEENYIFRAGGFGELTQYVELNQDMYLWVIEAVKLEEGYYTSDGQNIKTSVKFVAEGIKLKKPELPQLNAIVDTVLIRSGDSSNDAILNFIFPSVVENRKFKLKIGKVTDNKILKKIKDNDYTGIKELLTYAKNNNTIYSADLITTKKTYYSSENSLFDGISLLQDKAYYFVYAEFDDENGKYRPIEGVTLGQAKFYSDGKDCYIVALNDKKFEWTNLSVDEEPAQKEEPVEKEEPVQKEEPDNTTAPQEKLPQTGIGLSIISLVIIACVICYKKLNWYKDIN